MAMSFRRETAHKVNIDLNGKPYGTIYTYADKAHEWHPWHLKTLSGFYKTFGGDAYQTKEAKKRAGFDAMLFAIKGDTDALARPAE